MKTTIQKINGEWLVGYFGEDEINHYVEDGKTKDELLHKLIERVIQKEAQK